LFGSMVKLLGWTGALAFPAGLKTGFLTLAPRPLSVTLAPYSTSTGERFVTGSKTRARTFFFVALLARFWISFWDSFGPPMPLRAFIFCWRFILLAAWATALRVGLPFLEAVFAAPRAVAFLAGFFACGR
jgi:hypothetical protein